MQKHFLQKIIEKQKACSFNNFQRKKTIQDIGYCLFLFYFFVCLGFFLPRKCITSHANLKLSPFKFDRQNYLRKKSCPLLELLTNSIYSRSSGATDDTKVWSETDTALLMHANTELAQLRNLNFCKKENLNLKFKIVFCEFSTFDIT